MGPLCLVCVCVCVRFCALCVCARAWFEGMCVFCGSQFQVGSKGNHKENMCFDFGSILGF